MPYVGEYSINISISRPFILRDASVSHGQASVMESGDENERVAVQEAARAVGPHRPKPPPSPPPLPRPPPLPPSPPPPSPRRAATSIAIPIAAAALTAAALPAAALAQPAAASVARPATGSAQPATALAQSPRCRRLARRRLSPARHRPRSARRTTPPSPSPPPPHRLRHRLLPCCPRHPHRAQGLRPAEPEHSSAVAPSPSPPTPLHQRRRPADPEPDATISLLLSIQAGQQREWRQQASIEPLRAHSARRGGSRHPHTSLITPHTSPLSPPPPHRHTADFTSSDPSTSFATHLHHRHREAITATAAAAISAAPNAAAPASP